MLALSVGLSSMAGLSNAASLGCVRFSCRLACYNSLMGGLLHVLEVWNVDIAADVENPYRNVVLHRLSLVACCPGGPFSGVAALLARGDAALSTGLTISTTLLAVSILAY